MDKILAYDSWGVQIGYTYDTDDVDNKIAELKEKIKHLTIAYQQEKHRRNTLQIKYNNLTKDINYAPRKSPML